MLCSSRWLGVVVGTAVLTVTAVPSFAAIDKCSKLIDAEGLKVQSAALKGFSKCQDAYRKDILKPQTPALSKAAAACEKELAKIIGAGGALDKSINKLIGQVPKTCTDAELIALGHLSTAAFGSNWARVQGMAALSYAYEQQLTMTRDFVNIMQDVGDTGSCGSCKKLATAPCYLLSCKLSASSSAVNLATFSINVPLSGSTVFKICDASVIQGSAVGALYVLTSPGRILAPAPVGSIATACVKTISAEGIIQCGAGAQKTNYTTCLDHNTGGASSIAGATTSGDCTGDVCQGSVANNDPSETPGIINGGTCVDITNVSGAAGDAFINLTSQIGLAPLGDSCTNPDTLTSPGAPELTALTTGSPLATVKDADDAAGTEINSDPQTGSVFNCATLGAGQSAGTKLVGAYPSVNTLEPAPGTLLDSAIGFTLQCE